MTNGDDVNAGKGFGGWAKDRPFIKWVAAYVPLIAIYMGGISYSDGESWGNVLYIGIATLIGGIVLFSAVFLGISSAIWFFQRGWVNVAVRPLIKFVFTPIAAVIDAIFQTFVWILERAFKLIGILFVIGLALAILAGIAGLLLFGIRQLF